MATIQILMKEEDEIRLLGPRSKGRKTSPIADKITEALLAGYTVPDDLPPETKYARSQISIAKPVLGRLAEISQESGRSINFIVRNILGLDY